MSSPLVFRTFKPMSLELKSASLSISMNLGALAAGGVLWAPAGPDRTSTARRIVSEECMGLPYRKAPVRTDRCALALHEVDPNSMASRSASLQRQTNGGVPPPFVPGAWDGRG